MKKKISLLILLLTLFVLFCRIPVSSAQKSEKDENLWDKFPRLLVRSFFNQDMQMYYRFPTLVPLFDPLDLKYFPHETWRQDDWSLLERWQDTWSYHQMIMLREPAPTWIFHGTDVGQDYGFLDDFYLYATLFVADNYPDKSGSCYVYYSDSLLKGFGTSSGILVDPQSGVFKVTNTYGSSYNLTDKSHELTITAGIDPDKFPISPYNFASSSYAAADFWHEIMDEHFAYDWMMMQTEFHMRQSQLRTYRLELIRENGHLRVYINGMLAAELDDGIVKEDGTPQMVSWSFGPLLYTGGETVTCAVGDFYIYGKELKGAADEN